MRRFRFILFRNIHGYFLMLKFAFFSTFQETVGSHLKCGAYGRNIVALNLGKQWHSDVVSNIHVGNSLSKVREMAF